MKFFIDKEYAHRNTRLFLWLFVANVLIISALNAALVYYLLAFHYDRIPQTPKLFLIPFVISILVFLLTCYYSISKLSDGAHIATLLGGKLIQFPLVDEKEKRLYNIVEEMAIASGVPVPFVFVLPEESSINAFAAGSDPKNAAVAVTEGALVSLSRDELQAVIGHEFSHILHDDMQLNTQVAGAVNGFMFFMKMGEYMLRGDRNRRAGRRRGNGGHALWLFALGIWLLGSVGFFLGRYMQSLISQQREYLADASSAQFTRNPSALAQALAKIYNGQGSMLSKNSKYELAHIFFADGISQFSTSFFKTHPPLLDRISRLLPPGSKVEEFIFDKSVSAKSKENAQRIVKEVHKERLQKLMDNNDPQDMEKLALHATAISTSTLQVLRIPTEEHVKLSQELLGELPESARADLQNPDNAKANLLSVVISTNDQPHNLIKAVSEGHPEQMPLIERNLAMIKINSSHRLVLFQLSLGPLRTLDIDQKKSAWSLLFNAFQSDKTLTFIEALYLLIAKQSLIPPIKKSFQMPHKPDPYHAAAMARIGYWFGQNISLENLKNDIESMTGIPVPKIPEQPLTWLLFEDQFSKLLRLDLNTRQRIVSLLLKQLPVEHQPEQAEAFRLTSLCLGVPVPPLITVLT